MTDVTIIPQGKVGREYKSYHTESSYNIPDTISLSSANTLITIQLNSVILGDYRSWLLWQYELLELSCIDCQVVVKRNE